MDSASPLRVVVADDSAVMRRLLADALDRGGFHVVAAVEDGDQALAACRTLQPDVLSLDLAMPGLDGIGVLRALRNEQMPVPVVVVSAFSPAHGARAVDALAEDIVDEFARGVGDTGVRPGIIGEIGTDKPWVSALEERVHRAAARAARKTGLATPGARAARPAEHHGHRPQRPLSFVVGGGLPGQADTTGWTDAWLPSHPPGQ